MKKILTIVPALFFLALAPQMLNAQEEVKETEKMEKELERKELTDPVQKQVAKARKDAVKREMKAKKEMQKERVKYQKERAEAKEKYMKEAAKDKKEAGKEMKKAEKKEPPKMIIRKVTTEQRKEAPQKVIKE